MFFSRSKKTAEDRLNYLKKMDSYYRKFKGVKLSKKQIPHIAGWKTWEFF